MRHLRLASLLLSLVAPVLHAESSIKVPFSADRWQPVQDVDNPLMPDVRFIGHEGFPQGAIVLKNGSAALNGLSFRDGTIEFDMKATGQDIPGIQFRRHGEPGHQDAEEFYLRSFPECRASNDCIQYAPVIHGFMLWNVYPQYQTQAPIFDGWNHYKLVVSGRRMNVYINNSPQPILAVGNLESSSTDGLIQLRGPAVFANLTVTPGAIEGLNPHPTPDPSAADAGIVRQWQLGPQTPARFGQDPAFSEAPSGTDWKRLTAGRFGLVNLNREYELVRRPPSLTWLRTAVISSATQDKLVQLGWLGHVWVFVNGKLVTQEKNFYEPDDERRAPDGRLSIENGSFRIPLQKGSNQITLVLYSAVHDDRTTVNYYGWGAILRFQNTQGLQLSNSKNNKLYSVRNGLPHENGPRPHFDCCGKAGRK